MDKPDPAAVPVATAPLTELIWHDVTQWGVEGRAWPEQQRLRYFDRLPAAAEVETSQLRDFYG
ncbi:MAG: hypothetical protein KBF26_13035, partial [Opitutaceae bacterium]|nr:hypothetical protein [Opitutaceae bacterium]